MSKNIIRNIPRILPSKIIRAGESKKIDDIIKDELDSDKIFFNKKINEPDYRSMIDISIAYNLVNDTFGKKSFESKKFRDFCKNGNEDISIYYSTKKDTRYVDREQFNKLMFKFTYEYTKLSY